VTFAPEATVLATMPHDARNAESQRARWEGGRFPIIREYAWPLLHGAVLGRNYALLDALIDLVTPALVNLMGASLVLGSISAISWILGGEGMQFVTMLWGFAIVCGFGHVFLGLTAARSRHILVHVFTSVPRYALWKLSLYLRMVTKGVSHEWIRTPREVNRGHQERGRA